MEIRRNVFQAIADPTRRQIINALAMEPLNLIAIAENFDMTRQAVSLHIKILNEWGLINIRQQGREHYCAAQLAKLAEVANWVEQYRLFWSEQFDSQDTYLTKLQTNKKHAKRKSNK